MAEKTNGIFAHSINFFELFADEKLSTHTKILLYFAHTIQTGALC